MAETTVWPPVATFALNYSSSPTLVASGMVVNLPDLRTLPRQSPAPFNVTLTLQTPFSYTATSALVFEIVVTTSSAGVALYPLDGATGTNLIAYGNFVMNGTGCLVNGTKTKHHTLSDGDEVVIGRSRLRFMVDDLDEASQVRAAPAPKGAEAFGRVDAADPVVEVVGEVHADLQPEPHQQRRHEPPRDRGAGGGRPDQHRGDAGAERSRTGALEPDRRAAHGRFGNLVKSGGRFSTNASLPSCASSVM